MKYLNKAFFVIFLLFIFGCTTVKIDHSKPEMSIPENAKIPPKTFNQFHREWDY